MEINEDFIVMEAKRRTQKEIGNILRDLFVDLLKHEEDKEKLVRRLLEELNYQGSIERIMAMLKD